MVHSWARGLGAAALGSLIACSGAGDVTIGPPGATAAAPPGVVAPAGAGAEAGLKFPEVLSRGGPVIAAPVVLPILFEGDKNVTHAKAITEGLARDPYWTSVASEYGVGPLRAHAPVVMSPAPTGQIRSGEIEKWLKDKLSDGTFGAPDPSWLYAVYLPAGVEIVEEQSGGKSCDAFAGFHYEIEVRGVHVGYAVIPDCGDLSELAVSVSHEYFEWATDPFPDSKPAFNKLTPEHWAWEATMAGELSDLCDFMDHDHLVPAGVGYPVQRQWSNKLSRAGAFPCAPRKDVAYVQAVAAADDAALVPDYTTAANLTTKAIRVPPGGTRVVDVKIYSDQPAQGVAIEAQSYEELIGQAPSMGYGFALSAKTANTGDVVKLEVKAPTASAFDLVVLSARAGTETHYWPVLVVNDDAAAPTRGVASVTRRDLAGFRRMPETPRLSHARVLWRHEKRAPFAR